MLRRRHEELSAEQLRAAELGFKQLLRRKRLSADFLDRHAGDLLAQARFEYARHIADGDQVRSPVGWIIHCAWRRTQNLLEQESRAPRLFAIDEEPTLDPRTPTPEEETLEAERQRKIHDAVQALPLAERQVIALTYFEGMSVREASRTLGWDNCKGDRRHHAALGQLRELLGVEDAEQLQIEIGLAAWSLLVAERLGASPHLATLHGALESAGRGALELAARAQELARRVLAGGGAEGGVGAAGARSAEVGGGTVLAAATAGICGAAAVTCLATGVLGPSLGGKDSGQADAAARGAAQAVARRPASAPWPGESASRAMISPIRGADPKRRRHRGDRRERPDQEPRRRARPSTEPAPAPEATPQRVAREFDPFPEESAPTATETPPEDTQSPPTAERGGAPPPIASGKQVEEEFGF